MARKSASPGFGKPPSLRFLVQLLPFAVVIAVMTELAIRGLFPKYAIGSQLLQVPDICQSGVAQSEFNRSRCDEIWQGRYLEWGMAATPLWLALLFLIGALDSAGNLYKRASKRLAKTGALITGTVTSPAGLPRDAFAWFYCFRCLSVELPDGKQVRVYFPVHAPMPYPGQKLALVDITAKNSAQKRWGGILYAPHIAVMRGV